MPSCKLPPKLASTGAQERAAVAGGPEAGCPAHASCWSLESSSLRQLPWERSGVTVTAAGAKQRISHHFLPALRRRRQRTRSSSNTTTSMCSLLSAQRGTAFRRRMQFAVEIQKRAVRRRFAQFGMQLRPLEGRFVLRVGRLSLPGKGGRIPLSGRRAPPRSGPGRRG